MPILIGGTGERKTLRMVAQYAQACNLFAPPGSEGVDIIRHKLDVLRGHCDRLGTDYDAIEKTILYHGDVVDDPDTFLADMQAHAGLGVSLVEVSLTPYVDPAAWAARMVDEVVPQLADV